MAWYNSAEDLGKAIYSGVDKVILQPSERLDPTGHVKGINDRLRYGPAKVDQAEQFSTGEAEANFASAIAENAARREKMESQGANMRQMFQDQASGRGPSAAQDQLAQARDQNMRGALAMAASGRGNAALAMQSAGRERANIMQTAGQQASQLRAQEMQQGASNLMNANQYYNSQAAGLDQADQLERQRMEAINRGDFQAAEAARIAQQQAAKDRQNALGSFVGKVGGGIIGGVVGGKEGAQMGAAIGGEGGQVMMNSDEDTKTNKQNVADSDVNEFYKALESKSYNYKDPHEAGSSGGDKVGMMAQDVDKTELGKKLFSRRADGISQYDPQVLDGILLAGMKKLMKDQNYGDDS